MDEKTRYASAVIDAKTKKKVVRIAKRERTTKAVMAGRLLERGLAEYERLVAEGKDPHQ